MAGRLEALHDSGDYSDFTLVCGEKEIKIHKAIVCPQSDFFRTLCDPKFKEGSESRAILQETDPVLLEQAIRFVYIGSYSDRSVTNVPDSCQVFTDTSSETSEMRDTVSEKNLVLISDLEITQQSPEETVKVRAATPELNDSLAPVDHPSLLFNVRMYILADYLQIPSLKCEALSRCSRIMETEFEPIRMLEPFQEALENTSSDDTELRSCILWHSSEHYEAVERCAELDELLYREEPLAWGLVKSQREKHTAQTQAFSERITKLTQAVSILEKRLSDKEYVLQLTSELSEQRNKSLQECMRLTGKWSECRNCAADFNGDLDTGRREGQYFLRCKRCRCRHEGSSSSGF